ncbi:MAG: Holliday junction resolvase-like protein [Candidatus Aenigmarchaeota archaeon]|nr:Holliday junction resolvase-like protein [Candidatus Aenigmarchaeota archaeon]
MIWLIALAIGLVVGIVLTYLWFRARISLEVQKYVQENEERIRKETLEKSRAVLKGKIAEQIVGILPEFPYSPADARFIGNPIDYVIFDGYTKIKDESKGKLRIVFLDVKKGEKAELSKEEKIIKDCVESKNVIWRTLKLKEG